MPHVSLNFEDAPDGKIDFQAVYQPTFDAASPAHRLANQVIKFLDAQAASKTDIVVDDGCHL
jgi:hypothetical protein